MEKCRLGKDKGIFNTPLKAMKETETPKQHSATPRQSQATSVKSASPARLCLDLQLCEYIRKKVNKGQYPTQPLKIVLFCMWSSDYFSVFINGKFTLTVCIRLTPGGTMRMVSTEVIQVMGYLK